MPATAAVAACAFGQRRGQRHVRRRRGGSRASTIVAIVAVSCAAPVSISSVSPALRPVVLVSRTAVAPAADAAFRVVFVGRAARGVPRAVHRAVAHRRVALLRQRHVRRRRRPRRDRDVDVRRAAVQRVLELRDRDVVGRRQVQRLRRREAPVVVPVRRRRERRRPAAPAPSCPGPKPMARRSTQRPSWSRPRLCEAPSLPSWTLRNSTGLPTKPPAECRCQPLRRGYRPR